MGKIQGNQLRLGIEVGAYNQLIVATHFLKVVLAKETLTWNDLVERVFLIDSQLQQAKRYCCKHE